MKPSGNKLLGKTEIEMETNNECNRLIANCIIYYNAALLSGLYKEYKKQNNTVYCDLKKRLSPVAWQHINLEDAGTQASSEFLGIYVSLDKNPRIRRNHMPVHEDTIIINGSIEEVFNYKTTYDYWPEYHPLSIEVGPKFTGPTPIGTEFYEVVNVLSIKQKIQWKVTKCSSPHLFQITGTIDGFFGGDATITYTLKENEKSGTIFTRKFEIKRRSVVMKILDFLIIDRVADYDGKSALKNLKNIIEKK